MGKRLTDMLVTDSRPKTQAKVQRRMAVDWVRWRRALYGEGTRQRGVNAEGRRMHQYSEETEQRAFSSLAD